MVGEQRQLALAEEGALGASDRDGEEASRLVPCLKSSRSKSVNCVLWW